MRFNNIVSRTCSRIECNFCSISSRNLNVTREYIFVRCRAVRAYSTEARREVSIERRTVVARGCHMAEHCLCSPLRPHPHWCRKGAATKESMTKQQQQQRHAARQRRRPVLFCSISVSVALVLLCYCYCCCCYAASMSNHQRRYKSNVGQKIHFSSLSTIIT